MKNILFAFCILAPFIAGAQFDTSMIPVKNGKVQYEKVYSLNNNTSKDELANRAVHWMQTSFPGYKDNIKVDKTNGVIWGTGEFKVVVNENGNYYWLRPAITIKVNDGFYSFQAYNFYEKPIEKGISNDYSKIEYRWRDFKKGRPWSTEDATLFKGLNDGTIVLMASLEKEMSR